MRKQRLTVKEVHCKSAIGKCGFPDGGLALNPYIGCGHGCVYCYARFIRRFTRHTERWGTFVDVKVNIGEVLQKQMILKRFKTQRIYIGTVTDPYQPLEEKYKLMRGILSILINYENPVSILTKSDLILRDVDLLKKLKSVDINFTINSFNNSWKRWVEPFSPSIERRLDAIKTLKNKGFTVAVMMGPYWPFFTNPDVMIKRFAQLGVNQLFTESLNTIGENWAGVENVLKNHYPTLLPKMKKIFFDKKEFDKFYSDAERKIRRLSHKYKIPIKIYFRREHKAKQIKNIL